MDSQRHSPNSANQWYNLLPFARQGRTEALGELWVSCRLGQRWSVSGEVEGTGRRTVTMVAVLPIVLVCSDSYVHFT